MEGIRIANAPCSWGDTEIKGLEGESIGYRQMLNELVETGYIGIALGDWGYMRPALATLRAEISRSHLTMVADTWRRLSRTRKRTHEAHALKAEYRVE